MSDVELRLNLNKVSKCINSVRLLVYYRSRLCIILALPKNLRLSNFLSVVKSKSHSPSADEWSWTLSSKSFVGPLAALTRIFSEKSTRRNFFTWALANLLGILILNM